MKRTNISLAKEKSDEFAIRIQNKYYSQLSRRVITCETKIESYGSPRTKNLVPKEEWRE